MKKRYFLQTGAVLAAGYALSRVLPSLFQEQEALAAPEGEFEIVKTEEEWRELLTPEEFAVLRKHATERPFTSPLNKVKEAGVFSCAGCALPLYDSETKFNSGTGWPSFYQSLEDAVATKTDNSFMMMRTEVHCRRCGGHLGHIFNDGPKPTGKRHCINGVALKFTPASA